VFPFLSPDRKAATIASFRNTTEIVATQLPADVRQEFVTQLDQFVTNWQRYNEQTQSNVRSHEPADPLVIKYAGNSLRDKLSLFTRSKFFLVSEKATKQVSLVSLEFELRWSHGCHQIRATFSDSLPHAVFAVPVSNLNTVPKLVSFKSPKNPIFSGPSPEIVTIPIEANRLVYYASRSLEGITFDLFWDQELNILRYLSADFGVTFGDDRVRFDSDYLIDYRGYKYILRVANKYALLLAPNSPVFKKVVVADETAPEI
jgi:hypothetical protein